MGPLRVCVVHHLVADSLSDVELRHASLFNDICRALVPRLKLQCFSEGGELTENLAYDRQMMEFTKGGLLPVFRTPG